MLLSSCLEANPSLKLKYTLVFTPFNVAVVEVVCAIYGEERAYVLICALCVDEYDIRCFTSLFLYRHTIFEARELKKVVLREELMCCPKHE